LVQDRVQGPAIDTGLKFGSHNVPQSTCTRTVSFTLARTAGSNGASEGDVEGGIELVSGARCSVDDSKVPNYESDPDLKGYIVHQVTEVC
jgi:hypothetical protein